MRVVVTVPNGEQYRLDTPDPLLIGTWLKMLFDSWAGPGRAVIPSTFEITIS